MKVKKLFPFIMLISLLSNYVTRKLLKIRMHLVTTNYKKAFPNGYLLNVQFYQEKNSVFAHSSDVRFSIYLARCLSISLSLLLFLSLSRCLSNFLSGHSVVLLTNLQKNCQTFCLSKYNIFCYPVSK